jgi:hypothetical protein
MSSQLCVASNGFILAIGVIFLEVVFLFSLSLHILRLKTLAHKCLTPAMLVRPCAAHTLAEEHQSAGQTKTGKWYGRNKMLMEFLEKALAIGADAIEIEYKDRKEWIMAF